MERLARCGVTAHGWVGAGTQGLALSDGEEVSNHYHSLGWSLSSVLQACMFCVLRSAEIASKVHRMPRSATQAYQNFRVGSQSHLMCFHEIEIFSRMTLVR
jgi:hypothetical protein